MQRKEGDCLKKMVRARTFMYTQDLAHLPFKKEKLKEKLEKSGAEEWAYILHNKDTDENGKKIRPHFHVVLRFKDAKTLSRVAKLFEDQPQYVEAWHSTVNNAFSYLLHETTGAKEKHHYDASEVTASFDFETRIKEIRQKVKKPTKKEIETAIDEYASGKISKEELQAKIGVLEMARRKVLVDHVQDILAFKKHQNFLKVFKGQKCVVFWLYGEAGVGKTRLTREVLEQCHPNDFCILGSQRDHFQEYRGESFIVINDLRPQDYDYGQLLTLLDPYEIDKMAPSRYHDKYLNAKMIFITTPYSPFDFYSNCKIADTLVDTFEQLKRRLVSVKVTEDNVNEIKKELIFEIKLQDKIISVKVEENEEKNKHLVG